MVYKSSEFQKTLRQSLSIVLLQVCRQTDDDDDDDDDCGSCNVIEFTRSFSLLAFTKRSSLHSRQ